MCKTVGRPYCIDILAAESDWNDEFAVVRDPTWGGWSGRCARIRALCRGVVWSSTQAPSSLCTVPELYYTTPTTNSLTSCSFTTTGISWLVAALICLCFTISTVSTALRRTPNGKLVKSGVHFIQVDSKLSSGETTKSILKTSWSWDPSHVYGYRVMEATDVVVKICSTESTKMPPTTALALIIL